VEYGNLESVMPQLKLTPINRWGARVTAFDRKEKMVPKNQSGIKRLFPVFTELDKKRDS